MKNTIITALFALGMAGVAQADPLTDVYDASTGYVTLDRSDGTTYCSFTNGYGWADAKIPHSDTNYFIGRAQMRTPKDDKGGTRFAGRRLVLRTSSGNVCAINHPSSYEHNLTYPEVEFIRGHYNVMVAKSRVTFEKTIVSSLEADPFRFVHGQNTTVKDTTFTIDFGKVLGESGTSLKFENGNGKPIIVTYVLSGDFSDYQGQLLFRNQASASVTQSSLGGANVCVGTGCVFRCANSTPDFTVGGLTTQDAFASLQFDTTNRVNVKNLSLAEGSTLQVKLDWANRSMTRLDVSERVTVMGSEKPKIVVSCDGEIDVSQCLRFPLLTLPRDKGQLSADMFELVRPTAEQTSKYGLLPRFELSVETDGDVQTLYVGYREIVEKQKSDSDGSWMTDPTQWRDGILPTSDAGVGKDFYVPSSYTMYLTQSDNRASKHVVFGGSSLTVRGNLFTSGGNVASFSVPELIFTSSMLTCYGGGCSTNVFGGSANACVFKGGTITLLNEFEVFTYQGRYVIFDSEVQGDGTLRMRDRGNNLEGGSLWLTQMNTNFTGKIGFKANSDRKGVCFESGFSRYLVTDQRNLGGRQPSFVADAVNLGSYGAIVALGDVTFDEPTRGFTVSSKGQFIAENGAALTIKNRLTFNRDAELHLRNGSAANGRFALGGAGAAPALSGGAGSATLSITNTMFEVLSADAVEGLNVRFEAGATLRLSSSAEGDLAAVGLRNTAGSIASGRTDGKIPVAFDVTGKSEGEILTGVICTVSADSPLTADAFVLADSHPFGSNSKSYALRVTENTVGDTKVFTATAVSGGTLVIFR